MFIIQHSLLVCKVVQGHIHKESCVCYHNSLGRAQNSCLDILKNFVLWIPSAFYVNVQNRNTNIVIDSHGASPKANLTMFRPPNYRNGPYNEPQKNEEHKCHELVL